MRHLPEQEAGDRRRHEVRQRAGEHGPQPQSREIVPAVRRKRADAADLNPDRAEVREA
jgi:hypothetical protein